MHEGALCFAYCICTGLCTGLCTKSCPFSATIVISGPPCWPFPFIAPCGRSHVSLYNKTPDKLKSGRSKYTKVMLVHYHTPCQRRLRRSRGAGTDYVIQCSRHKTKAKGRSAQCCVFFAACHVPHLQRSLRLCGHTFMFRQGLSNSKIDCSNKYRPKYHTFRKGWITWWLTLGTAALISCCHAYVVPQSSLPRNAAALNNQM